MQPLTFTSIMSMAPLYSNFRSVIPYNIKQIDDDDKKNRKFVNFT